jgi:hypothetical protein
MPLADDIEMPERTFRARCYGAAAFLEKIKRVAEQV